LIIAYIWQIPAFLKQPGIYDRPTTNH